MQWRSRVWPPDSPWPRVAALALVLTVPFLLLAGLSAWRGAAESETRVVEQRVDLARAVALTAALLVQDNVATVRTVARAPGVTDPSSRPDIQAVLQAILAQKPEWEWLSLYGPDAWNIASTWTAPHTHNIADRLYFQQVMGSGDAVVSPALSRPVVSPAVVNRRPGSPEVVLAVPVDLAGGGRGVLAASLSVASFSDELAALHGRQNLQIIVLDQLGHVFIHPDPAVAGGLTTLNWLPNTQDVLGGKTGSRRATGPGGVEHLVAYAPVGGPGWGVVVAEPVAAAFGSARRRLAAELGLLTLTAVLTAQFGWALGARLSRSYAAEGVARQRADDAAGRLQRQLDFTSTLTRELGDGLLAVDRAGRLTFANPAAARLLGWREDELLGRPLNEVVHDQSGRCAVTSGNEPDVGASSATPDGDDQFQEVMRRGQAFRNEDGTFLRRDGAPLPVGYTVSPIFTAGDDGQAGDVSGAVIVFHDIEQRKRTETALRQANRAKDEFLAVVSHELRTPLTALMGYTDLLLRRVHGPLTDRQERDMASIRAAAQRQLALVNDLLDASKLEAGDIGLRPTRVEPYEAMTRAAAAMRVLADENAVRLTLAEEEPLLPAARADDQRLQQILANLLSNAIKFTPGGGSVVGGIRRADTPRGTFVGFSVEDTGAGIAPDQLARIWDRFYQADASSTRRFGGTGLGLTIVKRLTELHGGWAEARSAGTGQGSTFTVWLPAATDLAAAGDGEAGAPPATADSVEAA